MSTLKLEHIAHIDNAGPDISIDSSGHLNIVNGNLQMGGVTMLDASNGDLSTGNNASVNIRDAAGEVAGRIRNWSSPTNSIAIESDPSNSAAGSYLTFTVDGAQKMTILANGYVGIGTTTAYSASTDFEVKATDPKIVINNTGQRAFGLLASGTKLYIRDESDNQDLVTITEGGNVGIGYTGPNEKLHVDGYIEASSGFKLASHPVLTYDGFDGGYATRLGSTGTSTLNATQIFAGGSVQATFKGGNVGIGTTNPTGKLHADGAIISTSLAQGSGELQIQGYGNTGYINMNGSGSLIFRMGSSYSQDLKLTSAGILQGVSDAEIKTSPIRKHSNTISTNTTIDSSENAIASGPISVATGVTLTINGNMTVV